MLLDELKRILAELDRQEQKLAAIRIAEAIAILEESSPLGTEGQDDHDPSS